VGVVVVRYKTKPDRAEENQALIEKVFAELHASEPGGLRYMTFRLGDGVSFVHIANVEGDNPLATLASFGEFQRQVADRCEEPPLVMDATVVGSYGFMPLAT
jgi:hypothetical protein